MKYFFRLLLLCVLLLTGCGSSDALKGASKLPVMDVSAVQVDAVQAGASSSKPIALKADAKQLTILYLGYTSCPDICPTTLSDLSSARSKLGPNADRVRVVFTSVDGGRDTEAVLSSYIQHFGFGSNAYGVRPDDAKLKQIESIVHAASSVAKKADGTEDVQHTSSVYVINDRGLVIDEWSYGTPSNDMAHDLKVLLTKA